MIILGEILSAIARAATSFRRCRKGTTAIEFALIAPVFIAILAGTIEFGIAHMAASDMENAVRKTARDIRTGQIRSANLSNLRTQICNHSSALFNCERRMRVREQRFRNFGAASRGRRKRRGNTFQGSEVVIVTASYNYRWAVPFISLLSQSASRPGNPGGRQPNVTQFSRSMVFTNEDF